MIEIKVPATCANMGPGFDCLGMALNMYNNFIIEEIHSGLELYGCEKIYENKNNLVYTSAQHCFKKLGYKPKGLKILFNCDIPESRGLGSSAACILSGVLAANELSRGHLSDDEILEIATEIEGHPDNIAPSLFGGMIISIKDNEKVHYDKIKISSGFKLCALIPNFKLSTKEARSILPEKIKYKDAVFNVGRALLLATALTNGNFDLLKIACEDRLHQTYRGTLINNYDEILAKCKNLNCLSVFLSGSGPSIMVILREEDNNFSKNIESFLNNFKDKWTVKELRPDFKGAIVKNIN